MPAVVTVAEATYTPLFVGVPYIVLAAYFFSVAFFVALTVSAFAVNLSPEGRPATLSVGRLTPSIANTMGSISFPVSYSSAMVTATLALSSPTGTNLA